MTAPRESDLPGLAPSRLGALVALAAALAALAPFLALCAYAHPQNDDYLTAVIAGEHGVFPSVAHWLQVWTGRYFAAFLVSASPLTARSLPGWRWMVLADLLVLPIGAWMLVRALAPPSASRIWCAAIALGFAALHFAGMPDLPGGLYWMNGAVCYLVGEGLALGSAACMVWAETSGRCRWVAVLAGALLGVLAAGTNELIGLLLTGCFAVVLAGAALRRRALARLACLLLVTAAATAVTLLVPGTLERMRSAVPPGGRHVIQALGPSLAVAGRHSLEWIASPLAPAAWLLGLGVARIAATDEGWSLPHPAIAGAALAAAYFATVFLPYYGAGTLEKHTLNLAHALFTGGGLFLAACTGAWMGQRRRPATVWASVLRAGAWTLMVALAVLPPTPLRTAYGDLASGRAARYDQALLDRYELIAQCRYVVCGVPPLSDPPPSLFWFENAADEAKDAPSMLSYKDDTFAAFFGKARIRLTGQAPATTAHP